MQRTTKLLVGKTCVPLSESCACSFHVLGHGGCFGDEGHCDVGPIALMTASCTSPDARPQGRDRHDLLGEPHDGPDRHDEGHSHRHQSDGEA